MLVDRAWHTLAVMDNEININILYFRVLIMNVVVLDSHNSSPPRSKPVVTNQAHIIPPCSEEEKINK